MVGLYFKNYRRLQEVKYSPEEYWEAQQRQKKNYDKSATASNFNEGDLCMLKVEPRFCLDKSYKGPFRIQSLTTTNTIIRRITVMVSRLMFLGNDYPSAAQ